MNKKSIILAMNLITFCTTSMLPISHQQENAALLEYIYAADKVGKLAQFADDKYIEFLENNSEELQKEKSNYAGIFNNIIYRRCAFGTAIGAIGLGALFCINSTMLSLQALSFEHALERTSKLLNLNHNKTVFDEKQKERFTILGSYILKGIGGFILFDLGLRTVSHINNYDEIVQHDCEINALIKKK